MSDDDKERVFYEKDDEWYKSRHYYDLKGALNDVLESSGKEELKNIALLAGKTAFNTAWFTAKFGFEAVKRSPEIIAKAVENGKK